MANECKIYEMGPPRIANAPVRRVPFLAKQTLSSGGTSAAFNRSTCLITVVSSISGVLDFSSTTGTDPTGSLATFPINANQEYDFDVRPNTKVRFD